MSADDDLFDFGDEYREPPPKLAPRPPGAVFTERPAPLGKAPVPPAFPVDALGGALAEHVAALAEATQTDPGMAGTLTLGALAAAAGGKAVVEVRAGWREPVNVFVAAASAPGTRKSGVFRAVFAPVREAERTLVEAKRAGVREAQTARDVAERALEAARKKAGNAAAADGATLLAEAHGAAATLDALPVPALPRLLADDVTPEVMATLLAEHGGAIAVVSPEGGIFDVLNGRYTKTPNFDVVLKGHAGDSLRVDRRGRTEHVERPALTMALAVQPSVLGDIGRVGAFRGRGLLARFLYAQPPSNVGSRRVAAPPVPAAVTSRYATVVTTLATETADLTDPVTLQLTARAAARHVDVESTLEPRLGPRGDLGAVELAAEWGSKLAGAIARIAGLMHLAEHGATAGAAVAVTEETMLRAITLGGYFAGHALAVFDVMGADPVLARARLIRRYLRGRRAGDGTELAAITQQDLFALLPRPHFPKVDVLREALAVLEDHGWVARAPAPEHTGPGRPPSPTWQLHPDIHRDDELDSASAERVQSAEPLLGAGFADTTDSADAESTRAA